MTTPYFMGSGLPSEKGGCVIDDYGKRELHLDGIKVVEGSGISRENRISAREMKTILDHLKPHRHLLKQSGDVSFKTGTLSGIHTRVGYIERSPGKIYTFVVLLNSGKSNIDSVMRCVEETVVP
jgi:serine-type D-Ala-D-Ala carboxypeptidase/endopeptidase (penicillin-binding protein 4)